MKEKRNLVGPIILLIFLLIIGYFGYSLFKTYTDDKNVTANIQNIRNSYNQFTAYVPDYLTIIDGEVSAEEEIKRFRKSLEGIYEASYGGSMNYLHKKGQTSIQYFEDIVTIAQENEELSASEEYKEIYQTIEEIFNTIKTAETEYNNVAGKFNDKIDKFPRNLFAPYLNWSSYELIDFN